jgi:hypothetical protein
MGRAGGVVRALVYYALGLGLGGLVGYALSLYWRMAAIANVRVRPELANVSWWEAYLAGHLEDWLWYHYEDAMRLITVSFFTLIGLLIVYLARRRWF